MANCQYMTLYRSNKHSKLPKYNIEINDIIIYTIYKNL